MRNERRAFVEALRERGHAAPDDTTMALLHDIVDEGTLGASNHVRQIQELFVHLARTYGGGDGWVYTDLAADLIRRTRGAETPIVRNAVAWMLANLESLDADERAEELQRRARAWEDEARKRRQRLVRVGARRLASTHRVLAFDYSSTVADVLLETGGGRDGFTVVVPESRAIDGGWPYVQAFTDAAIRVEFVVDMAVEYALGGCDAVLLGVESLRADGAFLNTIGSRLTARLARARGVPVFGCSDLFKLDLDSYGGAAPEPRLKTFDERLLAGRDLPAGACVSTESPELEVLQPRAYDGLITDLGVLPPSEVWRVGREVFDVAIPMEERPDA